MVIMNLELDNIYGFKNFCINFSYPKKIVKSAIEKEFLADRPNFRYKKAVILMGANATGKTTLGRALLRIFSFIKNPSPSFFLQMISNQKEGARFSIDFVNKGYILHRVIAETGVINNSETASILMMTKCYKAEIGLRDTYEKTVQKLKKQDFKDVEKMLSDVGDFNYDFALDNEENFHQTSAIEPNLFLKVLKAVIGTLDPSLNDISVLEGVEDSYVIRRGGQEIILQKGQLTNQHLLSSGTIRGIDIAILMASIIAHDNGFYYCDEHFSYIQTDLEKRMFGIMLENLQENEQLIFTTHNSDMLDLNLPKHTYAFLSKKKKDNNYPVSVMYASDVLKRNTDSIRCAAENDVFSSIPDESLLDSLSNLK